VLCASGKISPAMIRHKNQPEVASTGQIEGDNCQNVSLALKVSPIYNSVTGRERGHMELQARVLVGKKGRIVIPAEIREAMGIRVGGSVDLDVKDYELRISTLRSRIKRAQERARKYIPEGVLLSEELSAERREAAKNE
jgi:AbrB family looped-hinge helix DNA binding protein